MKENKAGVLITGGTSGLGRSLARLFADQGHRVSVIGRSRSSKVSFPSHIDRQVCDFSRLKEVVALVSNYQQKKKVFDILINNAGILSPPVYCQTGDGFEFSYQVNFLAHVLLTHLLLGRELLRPGIVVNVSSPMYRKGHSGPNAALNKHNYGIFQAYANSKLYVAMFSEKLSEEGTPSFSYNPGTFSSEIYRMQKKWFHLMYRVASPFMAPAANVASDLFGIIHQEKWRNGCIIDRKGRSLNLNHQDNYTKDLFWEKVNAQIEAYVS